MAFLCNLPPSARLWRDKRVNPPEAGKSVGFLLAAYQVYVSTQTLDFLEVAQKFSFLDWKPGPGDPKTYL